MAPAEEKPPAEAPRGEAVTAIPVCAAGSRKETIHPPPTTTATIAVAAAARSGALRIQPPDGRSHAGQRKPRGAASAATRKLSCKRSSSPSGAWRRAISRNVSSAALTPDP